MPSESFFFRRRGIPEVWGCGLRSLMLLLAAVSMAGADDEAPVPSDPVFRALRTDASVVSGRLRRLDPDVAVVLENEKGESHAIPMGSLVSLRRETDPVSSSAEGGLLLFPDGDRLRGVVGSASETTLSVVSSALGDTPTVVPLESLLGVLFAPPTDLSAAEALRNQVRETPRDAEVLWLANGDRLSGSLLSLAADTVRFQPETGPVESPPLLAMASSGWKGIEEAFPQGYRPDLFLVVDTTGSAIEELGGAPLMTVAPKLAATPRVILLAGIGVWFQRSAAAQARATP